MQIRHHRYFYQKIFDTLGTLRKKAVLNRKQCSSKFESITFKGNLIFQRNLLAIRRDKSLLEHYHFGYIED